MANDLVRSIRITATGENIDSTTTAVNALGYAMSKLSSSSDNTKKSAGSANSSMLELAAGIYVAKSAYEGLSASADSAAALVGAMGAVLAYVPNKVGQIWQEGIDKLNSYVALSQSAGALSTDFYQRLTKGATDAKKPADEYLKVIQNLNTALDRQLGANGANKNGSTFNAQALDLQKNGNLQGQTADVNRLNNAITSPEQLSASLKLIQDTLDAGEKLVGLKLAGTLLGPEAAANLGKDNDYLVKMQASIDGVKSKDIIQQADVDRAAAMQMALDTATKYIDTWFTKSKSDWSGLGIEIQQLWVNAATNVESVLKVLDGIFARTKDIANVKVSDPENSIWTKIGDAFSNDSSGRMSNADRQLGVAKQSLGSQLGNRQNVTNATAEAQKADDTLAPDLSSTGAYAAATDQIKKYIDATTAATTAVSQTAGEQEQAKVVAQLYAAALNEGLSPALALAKAQSDALATAAGGVADALDKANKAKIATDAYTAATDGVKSFIDATKLEIEYHGQSAGALKQAQVNAQLYALALKEGMTPETAKAAVAASGLGKQAGDLATKLEALNKKPEAKDSYDRAQESILKYIETTKAAAASTDLSASAQERAKAVAQLTAAGLKDGLTPAAAAAKAQMSGLGEQAGIAADALAKAKIATEISRGTQTAFLSPEDVQIANQLKGIYGNDIPAALNSSQAAALRMNNTLTTINSTIRTGAASFATTFVGGLQKGESAIQALKDAASGLAKTLMDSGLNSLVNTGLNSIMGSAGGGAALTAGATSAAAAITAACTAGGASLAAGGTAAATALGAGGTVAGTATGTGGAAGGTALGVGGTEAGTVVGVGGVTAGAALTAGGTAAGAALWGPIAALAAVVASLGLSFLGGGSDKKAAQQAANNSVLSQAIQTNDDAVSRRSQDNYDTISAGIDTSSLSGQLQAFDLKSQQDREAEIKNGGQAIVELEKSQAAQRLAIIQKSNADIAKTLNDFLNSVKTGSQSILSPADQLAYEQNLFNTQLAGAQGGNADDLNALTNTASALLTLAQNFYASGTGYADTYNQVTNALGQLANNTNQTTQSNSYGGYTGYTVDATSGVKTDGDGNLLASYTPGYASGGIVANGTYGVDSVNARLAGGEHVTKASSVNSNTMGALSYINRTGKTPGNDNKEVVRVLTEGFNGQTKALSDRLDSLAAAVSSLNDTTRQTNNKRRVPGTRAA
jgi:hypothetical protein